MLQRMGGRKFVLSLLTLVMAGALLWAGKLDANNALWMVGAALGAHTTGNVLAKGARRGVE